jgi:hypothetical protein
LAKKEQPNKAALTAGGLKMENLKRIMSAFFLGLVVAIITKILISGICWQTLAGVFFFSTMLNIILEAGEADTAISRMSKRLTLVGAGILVFVAVRLIGDYVFGFPIGNVYGEGFGSVEVLQNSTRTLVLEILFSVIGIGIAYKAITSERSRKLLYVSACVAFVVILYQVKAPEMNNAVSRVLKATGIKSAQFVARIGDKLENDIEKPLGISIMEANLYEFKENNNPKFTGTHLKADHLVVFLGETRTVDGFVLRKVKIPTDESDFISEGVVCWVEHRCFDWEVEVGPNNRLIPTNLAASK